MKKTTDTVSITLHIPKEVHQKYKLRKITENDDRTLVQIYVDLIKKNAQ